MNTTAFQRPEGQWTNSQKVVLINSILRLPLCKPVITTKDFMIGLSVKPLNADGILIQRTGNTWTKS